jgi:adenylate cyclase
MASVARTGLPCAISFADVCGSAELYDVLGNTRTQAAIARLLTILCQVATRHAGDIVKTIGSEVMSVFPSARQAAEAAVDMHQSITQALSIEHAQLRSLAVRVGFHFGPVISEAEDVFGDAVNVAARVLAHAKPGQILLTKEAAKELPNNGKTGVRFVGRAHIKGKSGPVDLYEVICESESLTLARSVADPSLENARLLITFETLRIELGDQRPVLGMGRGTDNELVVPDPLASRDHARIEKRRGSFILIDRSLNGTYLRTIGQPERLVRRDETTLEASGLIGLGRSTADNQRPSVSFMVQKVAGPASAE